MFFKVFFFGKLKINIYVCVIDCIKRFRCYNKAAKIN